VANALKTLLVFPFIFFRINFTRSRLKHKLPKKKSNILEERIKLVSLKMCIFYQFPSKLSSLVKDINFPKTREGSLQDMSLNLSLQVQL
jgi:hypothetical protein